MPEPSTHRVNSALNYFYQGYNCAQSVFAAFADTMHMSPQTALMLAAPMGAGIGRMREVCGAFCALSLIAGSLHGNSTPDITEKGKIFALVQQLANDFRLEFGALHCKDLLGLSTEQITAESPLPNPRTPDYYAQRPCERCIAFCATKAATLIQHSHVPLSN